MKIFIIGSNGMLGKELNDFYKNHEIFGYDLPGFDILNENQLDYSVSNFNPDLVINCAAITNVDKCENEFKKSAYLVNVMGASNAARICQKHNKKLIHISTDFVFGGYSLDGDHQENETPYFKSVYGETKRLGEIAVLNNCKSAVIIRTAWLYGKYGNNFVHTMLKLMKSKHEINVVGDQYGNPTSTKELCDIINHVNKCFWNEPNESRIIHGTSKARASWYNFACEIKSIYNDKVYENQLDCKINSINHYDYERAAETPMNSSLVSDWLEKYMPNRLFWDEALSMYIVDNIEMLKELK